MFEDLEEEIEVKADEYALEESTACAYGSASKHVYRGYFYGFKEGAKFIYNKMNEWHYVKDKLPPEPEGKDGKILPKTYICAYRLNNAYDEFEVGDFMYLGNGVWNGENKEYPIYAWLAGPVDIPEPPKEQEQ